MKPEVLKQWMIYARSGAYEQGFTKKMFDNGCHCFIGLLCQCYCDTTEHKWNTYKDQSFLFLHSSSALMPTQVSIWSEIGSSVPHVMYKGEKTPIYHLGDRFKLSFKEIADIVEPQL